MRLLIIVMIGLTFPLGLFSIFANYIYGLTVLAGWERFGIAAALAIVDIAKLAIPGFLLWLITTGRAGGRSGPVMAGVLLWMVATVVSITSAFGLYETTRAERLGSVAAQKATHTSLLAQQTELKADLSRYRSAPLMEIIRARIRAMQQDKLWSAGRTNKCTDATLPASRAFCKTYEGLQGQLSSTITATQRTAKIAVTEQALQVVRTRLIGLNLVSVLSATDPATQALGRLLGYPNSSIRIRAGISFVIGLMLEFAGSLIPMIFGAGLKPAAKEPEPVEPELETPVPETLAPDARVAPDASPIARWAAENLIRRRGCHVPAAELLAAYARWAHTHDQPETRQQAFGKELTNLGFERKKSGKVHYIDVALAGEPVLRLISNKDKPGQVAA